jgi:primosomal protein N' (replication factor Y)
MICPSCKSAAIKQVGIGTQRVEVELKKLFPSARVLRADRDTTGTKHGFENIYKAFQNHEADVLVGTQMIAKGLDLPKVRLVGVMLADIGLNIPDFRSSERTFQLMTQVVGRAGRRENRGYAVIQTYSPDHPAIRAASMHDFKAFYRHEIAERKLFGYPPFGEICKLICVHPDKKACYTLAKDIADELVKVRDATNPHSKITICFAPAGMPRLHGTYRFHVFLQGTGWETILKNISLPRGVKIDRDPMMMG